MNNDGIPETKPFNYGLVLAIIPLLLAISVGIALYLGANEKQPESEPVAGEVTLAEVDDYLHKLTYLIDPRDLTTEVGRQALRSTAAMIDGTLGPENLGYPISHRQDPAEGLLWRSFWINTGPKEDKSPFVILIPYGREGHEVAAGLALAEYFTKHPTKRKIRLAFLAPLSLTADDVLEEGETLGGVLKLTAGGVDTKWATVFAPASMADQIRDLLRQRKWLDDVAVDPTFTTDEGKLHLNIHLAPKETQKATASRILRLLPVIKTLGDLL